MDLTFSLIILLCFSTSSWGQSAQWSYTRQDQWSGSCNTGQYQSPINIPTDSQFFFPQDFGNIQFREYNVPLTGMISNSGSSVVIDFQNSTTRPSFRGGGLSDKYYLQQFHFHWGGAEHLVNSERYSFEAHFVHYAQKYGTYEDALTHEDGIAVLATFYNKSTRTNNAFKRIVDKLPDIAEYGSESLPLKMILKDFFPNKLEQFFRYKGSLTTPECNEVVTWIIFPNPSYISSHQLALFSQVQSTEGRPIKFNYRKIQPLNQRAIYYNTD